MIRHEARPCVRLVTICNQVGIGGVATLGSNEVGVAVEDAHKGGDAAEQFAAGFIDLRIDFDDIVLGKAKPHSGTDPFPSSAWESFADAQSENMREVEKHGVKIGENVKSGAGDAGNTDQENASAFEGSGGVRAQ